MESSARADYVEDPRKLQSAGTLHAIARPGELLVGAEAVHFRVSVGVKQSAAVRSMTLCFSSESFLTGLTSTRLCELAQTDKRVPALQTVWQKLSLNVPKPARAIHWLVVSQHGARLHDYFDM